MSDLSIYRNEEVLRTLWEERPLTSGGHLQADNDEDEVLLKLDSPYKETDKDKPKMLTPF